MTNCYIHIPFCDLKCKYCRFASIGKIQNLHIEKYVSFLCKEIKDSVYTKSNLDTIYFGGGTPSILTKEQLTQILETLKNKFGFSEKIEITIESTPNNITKSNLESWYMLGINRISIGIQTLNEKSLREINRGKKGDIEVCLYNLVNFNKINNISLDFIIGLPYVKVGEILNNIKLVLNNYDFVKHVSVYMLEDYYDEDKIIETKFDSITYPKIWKNLGIKDKDFLGEYREIKNFLLKENFINYEISNFAKKGFKCKHNIGYWNHKENLAFGLAAHGFIKDNPSPILPLILKEGSNIEYIRYANSDNFRDYYDGKKIFENKLTKQDIFLEKIIFGLRTLGLRQEIYKKLDQEKIKYFIKEKCLIVDNEILKLTDKGVLIMDYIMKEII